MKSIISKLRQKCKNVVVIIGYLFTELYTQFILGIKYRWNIIILNFQHDVIDLASLIAYFLKILAYIGVIFGLLGLSIPKVIEGIPVINNWTKNLIIYWINLRTPLRVAIVISLTILFLYMIVSDIVSTEKLFKIATKRLRDNLEPSKRAIIDNCEAEELLRLIDIGKRNKDGYAFLSNLWADIISPYPLLSLFYHPIKKEYRPIVSIDISKIPFNQNDPEAQLGCLIKVEPVSRYKDYSGIIEKYKYMRYENRSLKFRHSTPRFLTRFRGPDEEKIGFRSDYEGYNVSLQTIRIVDNHVELPLICTMELYGNIMDSSDAMVQELFLHFASDNTSTKVKPQITLGYLPWRKRLHNYYSNNPIEILTNVVGRATGFGISALTIFNKNGNYVVARGERGTRVGTFQNVFHVVPAGMANIKIEEKEREKYLLPDGYLNIQQIVEREFMEEIFDKEEAIRPRFTLEDWPVALRELAGAHLYGITNKYRTNIYLTGIVFDLMNCRPEICTLILIRSEDWWDDHRPDFGRSELKIKPNYEYCDIGQIEINSPEEDFMPPERSVPAGIAALYLGLEKAKKLI